MRVAAQLIRNGIRGWRRNPPEIMGTPDFLFCAHRLVLFVDGCFWHGCRRCNRNIPRSRREFWRNKIDANRRRDRRVDRLLRSQGYHVMRVWEHHLGSRHWLRRLEVFFQRRPTRP
jgi:DNA mismatch endonuclease (patch repair protein)